MRRLLLLAALLLVAGPATAGMMLLGMGGLPGGNSYTPLCNVVSCTYALSTERQMVSTATVAFQVERSVDSTTQNVGFTGAGKVNTATVDAFCNAAVARVISRNCYISEVFDQTANGCNIYNSTVSAMPDYMVSPTHGGLPLFQKTFQGSTASLNFLLDNNGGNTGALSAPCNLLTGGAQSLFFSGNSTYGNNVGGQAGLQENTPGVVTGSMFSAYVGITGLVFDQCSTDEALPCGGMDTEGQGPQAPIPLGTNNDVVEVAAYAGGTGAANIWVNGAQITTNETMPHALVTQGRMSWGTTGDHTSNGPTINRSEAFFTSDLNSGQQANLYSNETSFIGTLSIGYAGPGDLFGETSTSSGVITGRVLQLQWLSQAFSLRKTYAGYEGPALNVCQGQGAVSCEDIGWVNNTIDTATMSAFCGPVSGLNDCAVQIWYNQALNQNSTVNTVNTALDATATTTSKRPTIAWSGCQTTAITVCLITSSTNYFTTGGITIDGGYTMSAVAQRTGSLTSTSAIYSSGTGTGPETFIGFNSAVNSCFGTAHNGGGANSVAACADSTVHSITLDAGSAPSAILYVDGTAGTTITSTVGYSSSGLGVGATGAGSLPCACQLSEILIFADSHNISFTNALGSGNVAILRANQRAAFGF